MSLRLVTPVGGLLLLPADILPPPTVLEGREPHSLPGESVKNVALSRSHAVTKNQFSFQIKIINLQEHH